MPHLRKWFSCEYTPVEELGYVTPRIRKILKSVLAHNYACLKKHGIMYFEVYEEFTEEAWIFDKFKKVSFDRLFPDETK